MFGKNKDTFGPPSSNDKGHSVDNLISLAEEANALGNLEQAAHLYLAASDAADASDVGTYQPAVEGLHKAWGIALRLKDRALAEHVFEKLESYLSGEEVATHAESLQRLALDKLEEFGLSRENIQDMADMMSEDFAASMAEGVSPDALFPPFFQAGNTQTKPMKGVLSWPPSTGEDEADQAEEGMMYPNPEDFGYADLVGFDRAIAEMNKRGIGLKDDLQFTHFVEQLSRRHGIDVLPAFETLLFTGNVREDARQFMLSTAKEIGAPGVRMFMDETPMGFPVLCVVTTSDFKFNFSRGGFMGKGVLLLEDIDSWGAPFVGDAEDMDGMPPYAYMTRGARDAIMFIRSAVDNPEVTVMATCHSYEALDDFFIDLLGPVSIIPIDRPNAEERRLCWKETFRLFPSLRLLPLDDIVRLSAGMSRFEIYIAGREVVEDAYRASIETRSFVPVLREDMFEKIALFLPLDSREYQELEDYAVAHLLDDIENIDDLLEGMD